MSQHRPCSSVHTLRHALTWHSTGHAALDACTLECAHTFSVTWAMRLKMHSLRQANPKSPNTWPGMLVLRTTARLAWHARFAHDGQTDYCNPKE